MLFRSVLLTVNDAVDTKLLFTLRVTAIGRQCWMLRRIAKRRFVNALCTNARVAGKH